MIQTYNATRQLLFVFLALLGAGVAVFGVRMLISAFDQQNPLHFLVIFFSACLVTLLGAALCIGLVIRLVVEARGKELPPESE